MPGQVLAIPIPVWKAGLQLASLLVAVERTMATSEDMGPAGFMWPPDRVWSAPSDNTSPCGSVDGVTFRTEFPLTNGAVALVAQDDSYSAQLSISFSNDPKTQTDFTFVANPIPFKEIDPGHSCFSVPNPPSNIAPGTNATIQIKYTADFDKPANQTFYACTDITYVPAASFKTQIPCFNATNSMDDVPAPTSTGIPTGLPGHGDSGPPLTMATPSGSAGDVALSKGAIAGAVIGAVVGLALIIGLCFLLYRETQKKKRLEQQRDSARGVKWHEDPDVAGKDSASAGSFRMNTMSGGTR